jgi:hypothetical protein
VNVYYTDRGKGGITYGKIGYGGVAGFIEDGLGSFK